MRLALLVIILARLASEPAEAETCQPGSFRIPAAGGGYCVSCEPGKYSTAQDASACPFCNNSAGLVSLAYGATACAYCPLGYRPDNPYTCAACAPGTYASAVSTSVVCLRCPPGSYSGAAASTACDVCAPGRYALDFARSACTDCLPGSYRVNVAYCQLCEPGWYAPGANAAECARCDNSVGLVSLAYGGTNCTPCPPGQRARSPYECAACSPGTYSVYPTSSVCPPCPPGSYAPGAGATACARCEVGTYSQLYSRSACTACPPGMYTLAQGSATNEACVQCAECPQGRFTAALCGKGANTRCDPCTAVCPRGTYQSQQVCTRGSSSSLGWNTHCEPCTGCPAGQYLASSCDGVEPYSCLNCSRCDAGAEARPCTNVSDTVCADVAQCHNEFNYTWPDWLPLSTPICRQGQYALELFPGPVCASCPSHTVGNGLFCAPCTGFKLPYFDQLSCVCQRPAVPTEDGDCECPAGHEFADDLCAPCPPDTYRNRTTHLPDDWWTQYAACDPCPPGSTSASPSGSTACIACAPGLYREPQDAGCQACPLPGHHALDGGSAASCAPCRLAYPPGQGNTSCPYAYGAAPCPGHADTDYYDCLPCPTAPDHSSFFQDCYYACDPGYYKLAEAPPICAPCNASACAPGYNRTACQPWRDGDCDTPCDDQAAGKPLWYASYSSGCQWACEEGYTLTTHDYKVFALTQCVPDAQDSFWSQLFAR